MRRLSMSTAALSRRCLSTAPPTLPSFLVLAMPQLSPTMTKGTVVRFLKAPGEPVELYDMLVHVETNELLNEHSHKDEAEASYTMQVETQDEGYWVGGLVAPDTIVAVDGALGIVAEDEEDVGPLREAFLRPNASSAPRRARYTVDDALADGTAKKVLWQAYLLEEEEEAAASVGGEGEGEGEGEGGNGDGGR